MLDLFESSPHLSLSAHDIAQELLSDGISLSSIYRNLAAMVQKGLLCKTGEKSRAGALYHYVNPESCSGIIHLKCQHCNATYHIDKCVSDMIFAMAEKNLQFQINKSSPFLFGKCANCSQKDPS